VSETGDILGEHPAGHGHKQWYEFAVVEPHRSAATRQESAPRESTDVNPQTHRGRTGRRYGREREETP
ncbi:hypothetical protein ACFQ65_10385, partial [Streptomyces sp. NPDC056450]|uniref:hypothetical protein n=1 Tax=Streptomyces sp. NPDC056450 TaxID=3345820 RepID=UPI0036AEC58B